MISLEKALKVIENIGAADLPAVRIHLKDALSRVLAEDVYADCNFPSFDKSAMDGYAIRREDINKILKIIEFIPAGKKPVKSIEPGTCSKIMTGAMLPEGADVVVMKEDVIVTGESISIRNADTKDNILKQGEDLKSGSLLLNKGTVLNPIHIGLLASVGATEPKVYKPPVITVFSTGDELVSPEERPVPPKIRNSNSAQLIALSKLAGCRTFDSGQVGDDSQLIFEIIQNALADSDIILLTGGASVGDLDYTGEAFEKLKSKIHFTRLAIQPGKPVLFATVANKYLFGLSGNPVSSFVQFHLLVKPLINKLSGIFYQSKVLRLPISIDLKRRKSERTLFIPVRINDAMEAEPLEYHGSAHLNAYQKAEAMACFPMGIKDLKQGTLVDVRPV